MLLSTKVSLIFPLLMFKERILSIKEDKIGISFSLIPFLLTLLKCMIQYLYPPLNPSHPLSLLLRIE